jgi:hypothetical protein
MRHWKIWLYLIGMTAIIISCVLVSNPNDITTPFAPTQNELASQTVIPVRTTAPISEVAITSTAEVTDTPTEAPTVTEIAAVDQVDQCVECHTDSAKLIDTAAPEEEIVEESEGAG